MKKITPDTIEEKMFASLKDSELPKSVIREEIKKGSSVLFTGPLNSGKSTAQMVFLRHIPNEKEIFIEDNQFYLAEHLMDVYPEKRISKERKEKTSVSIFDEITIKTFPEILISKYKHKNQVIASFAAKNDLEAINRIKEISDDIFSFEGFNPEEKMEKVFDIIVVSKIDANGFRYIEKINKALSSNNDVLLKDIVVYDYEKSQYSYSLQ